MYFSTLHGKVYFLYEPVLFLYEKDVRWKRVKTPGN